MLPRTGWGHLSGGKFVGERGQPDGLGLLQQIGAVPTAWARCGIKKEIV